MAILFILELNLQITGFDFHEMLGLCVGLILIIHLCLNFKWIKVAFKSKNNKMKTSIILNLLLFSIMIITGIMISKLLFSFSIGNSVILRQIHQYSSYISGLIILIHLCLHYKYLKNIMIKIFLKYNLSFNQKLLLKTSSVLLGELFFAP